MLRLLDHRASAKVVKPLSIRALLIMFEHRVIDVWKVFYIIILWVDLSHCLVFQEELKSRFVTFLIWYMFTCFVCLDYVYWSTVTHTQFLQSFVCPI